MRQASWLALAVASLFMVGSTEAVGAPDTLRVAFFSYVPARDHALKAFVRTFTAQHPDIVLEAKYWDTYADAVDENGIGQIKSFDVVEVDLCRFDEIVADARLFSALDSLPIALRAQPGSVVGPARMVVEGHLGAFAAPHWICGNFLISWARDVSLPLAAPFNTLVRSLSPERGEPLLGDFFGSSTLGEHFADAYLDRHGAEATRRYLLELVAQEDPHPDGTALEQVMSLTQELPAYFKTQLEAFHERPEDYAWTFANIPRGALIGYSEQVFFVEQARRVRLGSAYRPLSRAEVRVRRFQFTADAPSSPGWVDAFLIPKGRLMAKEKAIEAFIRFAQSERGYESFLFPLGDDVPSYLLPAMRHPYESLSIRKRMPLLDSFRAGMDHTFPVIESRVWRGMRKAGSVLKARVGSQ